MANKRLPLSTTHAGPDPWLTPTPPFPACTTVTINKSETYEGVTHTHSLIMPRTIYEVSWHMGGILTVRHAREV